ncbi:MAG: HK97 gp10 family phage protein [Veillonellales bacterium]
MGRRSFEVNIRGIQELKKVLGDFKKYDESTQEKLRTAVRTSTKNIMDGARRRVRIVTGNLIKDIYMTYDEQRNIGVVHANAPHAHLVELGHKGGLEIPVKKKALHGGKIVGYASKVVIPTVAPHPFLRPAFEDEKPNLIKNVKGAVEP